MKTLRFSILAAALALAGCAQTPPMDGTGPAAQTPATAIPAGISFSVSGEPRGANECFVRYEIGYPEDVRPVTLLLELETEMRRDDGDWMVISWTEGIRESPPSPEAIGRPGGGGLMHYIEMNELLLACDQLRTRVIVNACEPAPCPPLSIDSRANLFELLLDDRSPR
jgi:hypothetical protein